MAVFPTITVDRSSINISDMTAVLEGDDRVVFAYPYGSFLEEGPFRDVDIAVFTSPDENPFEVSADLKIALSRRTGIPPDCFDIRVINQVVDTCDLTGLLYLEDVFTKGRRLVDKDRQILADYLERFGWRYRECLGLIQEFLS
ncbi:MAG: hypothetical protein WHS86_05900 [Desulfosoma sp.]